MTRSRALRITIASAATVGLIGIGLTRLGRDSDEPEREAGAELEPRLQEVERTLRDVGRAWNPAERERMLLFAATSIAGSQIVERLQDADDHLLLEAVLVAGKLGDANLAEPLRQVWHRGPEHLRAAVLRALEKCEPWSNDELVEILRRRHDPEVHVAAIGILARRRPRPVEAILNSTASDARVVRDAALAALRNGPRDDERARIVEFAKRATGNDLVGAIRALDGNVDAEAAALLTDLLRHEEALVRAASMISLATFQGSLQDPSTLVEIAKDRSAGREMRALALHCLEASGTETEVEALVWTIPDDQVLRYFLARYLVRRGSAAGVDELLAIAASELPPTNPTLGTTVQEARRLVRRLMGVDFRSIAENRATSPRGLGTPNSRSRVPEFLLRTIELRHATRR